jgi:hypothetical protein
MIERDRLQFGARFAEDGNSYIGGNMDESGSFERQPDGSIVVHAGCRFEEYCFSLSRYDIALLRQWLDAALAEGE